MNNLITAMNNQRQADVLIGIIPNDLGGEGIKVIAANKFNRKLDATVGTLKSLERKIAGMKYNPEMAKALNWDWEVELEHRLAYLDDDSMLAMMNEIVAKKDLLARNLGTVQALNIAYPEHWINLSLEELKLWSSNVNRSYWELLV